MILFVRLFFFLLMSFSIDAATHKPAIFLKQIKNHCNEGQQIVQNFCLTCHASQPEIPVGAPRAGVAEDWRYRLKQPSDIFLKHVFEGYGAMPARGGCFECSDAQLMLAIESMIHKNNLKDFIKIKKYKKISN